MATDPLTDALQETLALFEGSVAPWTTSEIARELDLGRRSTYDRLERLVDEDRLRTKKVGGNGRVWWRPPTDGDIEGNASVGRDMSDRREQARQLRRERELEQYETIFSTMQDGVYVLDDDFEFVTVNDAYVEMTGYDREELLGTHYSLIVDGDATAESARTVGELLDGAVGSGTIEADMHRADGTTLRAESRFTAIDGDDGRQTRTIGIVRDVSERVERERELGDHRRWTQTLMENFPAGAIAIVDEDVRYIAFGGEPEGETRLTKHDLDGEAVREVLPTQLAEVVVPAYENALDGTSSQFEETIDDSIYQFHFVPVRDDGDVIAATAMSQDITDRNERERYLEDATSQLEAATEAGAVGTFEWHVQDDEMLTGASFAQMFGVDPTAAGEGVSLDQFIEAVHEDDRERVERQIETALETCGEYEEEYRVRNADDEVRWVVARGHVECEDGTPVTFPGALTDITEQKEAEIKLSAQRERLAALDELNGAIREITGAVIDQTSRDEIETIVCERLADSDSYQFAWIGDVDPATETVNLRTEAGVEGYLDDITISVDSDDERSEGPTGRALRTGETQVTHDIRADDRHDPWRGEIERYGVRSSAAIPIVYENTTYGVLNVYALRSDAFTNQEREMITQLGEIIGHAIAATDRKQALMSDDLVELDLHMNDILDEFGATIPAGERITFDHAVARGGDEFLVYGTATPDAVDTVRELDDTLEHWESVDFFDKGDSVDFELRMSDPPVLSMIASLGGHVEESVVADGDFDLRIHLAPSVDVRRVMEIVEGAYPDVEMHRRRQITRTADDPRQLQRELLSDLTEKQRTSLEVAYHVGFFEWPRTASGEDVAASLGVSPPTFHQHLRKAERTVFESLLSSTTPA